MAFFNSAVTVLQTLVVALGVGLGIWGAINLLEGYGNDNPSANADYYGIPLIPIYKNTIRIQYLNLEIFVGRKNICVRTHIDV